MQSFPELFTLQLLSIENKRVPASEAISALTNYTARFKEMMSRMAVSYNVNIIGGSHPNREADGEVYGGDRANVIDTDCGPIGVMICYDCKFPELVRHVIDQGAAILFVPFCTDERQSYMRVRYCAQARAVENQCFVVMAGNVGNLPKVENMDIQYSQSCVLTPAISRSRATASRPTRRRTWKWWRSRICSSTVCAARARAAPCRISRPPLRSLLGGVGRQVIISVRRTPRRRPPAASCGTR